MREVDVKDGLLIRVFVLGYRRPDLIYYFKSCGYASRSRPLLVGRAPSVHVPLPHQTLCLDIAPPLLAYIRAIRLTRRPAPFHFHPGPSSPHRLNSAVVDSFRRVEHRKDDCASAWFQSITQILLCFSFFFPFCFSL